MLAKGIRVSFVGNSGEFGYFQGIRQFRHFVGHSSYWIPSILESAQVHLFIILKRVNVVFEAFRAFRGQLRRPLMFLEFYHTCFRILPHTFRILPHTLQRACPLQRPLDPTRHNPTGRPGGREAGGREAGRPGGWEAGRPCLLLASCITLF